MCFPLIRYVLTAALRDKLIIAMGIVFILILNLAVFSGSSAVIESQQFVVVFAGGGLRLAGVTGLVLFVCFFIRRSFEAGDIELMLSRPLSRAHFIISYGMGFCMLALLAAFVEGLAVYSLVPGSFMQSHMLWIFSVAIENMIMVMVAFFFAMVLSNAAICCLASFAFYVLSRMIGQLLGIIESVHGIAGEHTLKYIMKIVAIIVPRLDLMGQTGWLVYGIDKSDVNFAFIGLQGFIFILLIFLASLVDLERRQF